MTEQDFEHLLDQYGIASVLHAADRLETLMPDLLKRPGGAKARQFIAALRMAAARRSAAQAGVRNVSPPQS